MTSPEKKIITVRQVPSHWVCVWLYPEPRSIFGTAVQTWEWVAA